ncbi:YifB family Mg chelatase-like AAA ATPase [Nocardioides sp. R-C-SC26]|uniref:YifB family Mg chelatase-like AAA ATPase n=1 Tax=Nocardioides sp. R-C-SC26 TaxID=2870414 RepID=UPI001E3279F7|nr:YifB family Mg chelatase-like AAA ATPase [Nocardioides sp. R-C-SC26]
MGIATATTISLYGALGHVIDVQADVAAGAPGFTMVGRPDQSLREAFDRCKSAVINSHFGWPATKRVTVLLSPADLTKRGPHFDLSIAVAILAADGQIAPEALAATAFIGELTLEGGLRCVPGVLPMVLSAADRGVRHVFVPEPQAAEAAMVPGMAVFGMRSLGQVVAELNGDEVPVAAAVAPVSGGRFLGWRGDARLGEVDLADLHGMPDAKFAVEVAAAGGHHLLLTGPKGAGKTSLAERIPTLLPELTPEESLEITALCSLAGDLDPGEGLIRRPPYAAPHHDASKTSIIGGGSGQVRPGEVSRCHAGVLFLDEFALFRHDIIEALRQPLESGDVTIARRDESVTLPARTLLVLASNPCPCGNYGVRGGRSQCSCRVQQVRAYRAKLAGPLVDRIDITRALLPLRPHEREVDRSETSAQVRARVHAARERQTARYRDCGWRLNAHVAAPALRERWPLPDDAARVLDTAQYSGALSGRGAVRVHRLAWTLADLRAVREGSDVVPGVDEVDLALRLRTGDPLPLRQLGSGDDAVAHEASA